MRAPGAVKIGPIHFVTGWRKRLPYLNQALVLIGLVLLMLVVCSNYCSGFFVFHLVVILFGFASTSQMIG